MNLKEFIFLHPDSLFIRFIYNIEYFFNKTYHWSIYIKYDSKNIQKSLETFDCLLTSWSVLSQDYKIVPIGYDKIFNTKNILQQIKEPQKIKVQNTDKEYYFNILIS